jgi:16S rRNA (uracil1498-N3)-methyltransferase
VSAPVFLAPSEILRGAHSGHTITIHGAEARHAIAVQRLRAGEHIELVDGAGLRASGRVDGASTPDALHVLIDHVMEEVPGLPQVIVVQALPKGDRGERAVEMLTEVGVDRIVPWAAEHCITKWKADREAKSHAKWVSTAGEAAKQARRARWVHVDGMATTPQVLELIGEVDCTLVLDESATEPIPAELAHGVKSVALIVGPEGGISAAERDSFRAAGAQFVRLGPTVLRTSTAGVVAAAVVLAGTTRWGHESIAGKGDVSD